MFRQTQTLDTQQVTSFSGNFPDSPERGHLIPSDRSIQFFSPEELSLLTRIINYTQLTHGKQRRIYWCTRDDLVIKFSEPIYLKLLEEKSTQEWLHPVSGDQVTTLTPWTASILGVKLVDYWIPWIKHEKEYRGVGRPYKRIRVRYWDTESCWTYEGHLSRSLHMKSNTNEIPLVGDPEDKTDPNSKREYLEDWQTWEFTRNPKKALTLKIRVGGFTHEIPIERDCRHTKKNRP